MKALAILPVALLALAFPTAAETPPDLVSPKPESPRLFRVLLHLPGSARLLDYPDVERLLCCEKDRVAFETHDGTVVFHQGSFTILEPRSAPTRPGAANGPRFYDIR